MSKRNQILDLYENHLQNELREHRRAINDIKKKISQIKAIKMIDESDSIGNELNEHIKVEESDSEKIEANTSVNTKVDTSVNTKVDTSADTTVNTSDNTSDNTSNDELNFDNIKQYFVCVESEKSKFETVCELYKTQDIESAVIYCNSGKKADSLSKLMEDNGFSVKSLLRLKKKQKDKLIGDFLNEVEPIQAIIALKRVKNLRTSFIINYDLPPRPTYIKKIGNIEDGPKYAVINLITKSELKTIDKFEKYYGTKIVPIPIRIQNLI